MNNKATLELGNKPVGKLLMQYSLPAIIAMTASSLYNMVDSIFIGQGVGPMAISGLALTFPFMNLGAAFGARRSFRNTCGRTRFPATLSPYSLWHRAESVRLHRRNKG